jgi:glycosyltransferase involved in cell wall biosynthesis
MILYLGNKLTKHGVNPTSVETLGERLKEFTDVMQFSDKKNPLLRMLDMWFQLVKYRRRASLVIIDTYSTSAFHFSWTSARLCEWLHIPYGLVLRGGNLEKRFQSEPVRATRLLKKAKKVIAPSGYLFEVATNYSSENLTIIPNFIDLANYPFKERTVVSAPNILWVRAFDKIYRPHLAVAIVSELRKIGIGATLTFVGPDKDGTMSTTKELATQLGVADAITFTGRLPKEEWIALAESHDIFLNTTSIDNTPVSVMEAMALGMPIVTTSVGGIPFLFENHKEGIMVNSSDASDFSEVITSLLQAPETLTRLSNAAREKASSWDWEVVKSGWKAIVKN